MKNVALSLLAITLLFAACKKKDSTTPSTTSTNTTTTPPPAPPTTTTYIVPLKTGNTWHQRVISFDPYVDTAYEDITVGVDSTIAAEIWYNITGGDSPATIETNRTTGFYDNESGTVTLLYKYPASVNDTYISAYGDTVNVLSINAPVTVPNGTYTCYHYHIHNGAQYYIDDYEAPGVGPIKQETYFYGTLQGRLELMTHTLH